jgi:hypothetical protein
MVAQIDPGIVPNASMKIPPSTGRMVLTMATDDCSTPYCEFVIPNSYSYPQTNMSVLCGGRLLVGVCCCVCYDIRTSLIVFFIAPNVCAAK